MDKGKIAEAISKSYEEGLGRAYDSRQMVAFMFLEGMRFQKTGKVRENSLDKILTEKKEYKEEYYDRKL